MLTDKPEFLVSPAIATSDATHGLANILSTETEAGRGELNDAASWDDFPNGRFGDFKSPAFGNQDPWGGPTMVGNQHRHRWIQNLIVNSDAIRSANVGIRSP